MERLQTKIPHDPEQKIAGPDMLKQIESGRHVVLSPVMKFGVDGVSGSKIESPAKAEGGGFSELIR